MIVRRDEACLVSTSIAFGCQIEKRPTDVERLPNRSIELVHVFLLDLEEEIPADDRTDNPTNDIKGYESSQKTNDCRIEDECPSLLGSRKQSRNGDELEHERDERKDGNQEVGDTVMRTKKSEWGRVASSDLSSAQH